VRISFSNQQYSGYDEGSFELKPLISYDAKDSYGIQAIGPLSPILPSGTNNYEKTICIFF
jgi:hypothetical protein